MAPGTQERWEVLRPALGVVLRCLATVVALLALYYLIPVRAEDPVLQALWFALELVLFIGVVGFMVYRVMTAGRPRLRAIQAMSLVIPLFILLFARIYLQVSSASPTAFSTRLDHSRALYFTVTTFTTTGFGDITATTDGCRLLVTLQMVLDLVVLATTAKLLFGAAQRGLTRQRQDG